MKMTKREMFESLKAKYDLTDKEKAFIDHELELLAKKNSGERKPTAQQTANAAIKDEVKAILADGTARTVGEILKALDLTAGLDIVCDTDVAKVSVVGAGMETHPGVASTMFEALFEADINIQMIATSEIKISVLIDAKDADKAVEAVHSAFIPVIS